MNTNLTNAEKDYLINLINDRVLNSKGSILDIEDTILHKLNYNEDVYGKKDNNKAYGVLDLNELDDNVGLEKTLEIWDKYGILVVKSNNKFDKIKSSVINVCDQMLDYTYGLILKENMQKK